MVTVVDGAGAGTATAAGAGEIVQPWSSTADGAFYDLYAAGAAAYPQLVGELAEDGAPDVGWAVRGSLVVDVDPARLDEVAARVRARTADPPGARQVERLSPAAARALFPPLALQGPRRRPGPRRWPGGRPPAARRAPDGGAAARRRRRGGTSAARPGPRGAPEVVVDGEPLPADAVVVAAGAWTDRLLAPLGCAVGISAQPGQIVHLSVDGQPTGDWPSVLPLGGHYLVPFEDGRVAAGATRETGSGFDPRVTAAGLQEVLDHALAVAPGLSAATVLETRVGLRTGRRPGPAGHRRGPRPTRPVDAGRLRRRRADPGVPSPAARSRTCCSGAAATSPWPLSRSDPRTAKAPHRFGAGALCSYGLSPASRTPRGARPRRCPDRRRRGCSTARRRTRPSSRRRPGPPRSARP